MAGFFDFIPESLTSFFGSPASAAEAQPSQPSAEGPSAMDRFSAGIGGFANSGAAIPALVNLFGGLATGQRTDLNGIKLRQFQEQQRAAQDLISKFEGMPPEVKRFLAANPEAWKALSTAIVSPQTTTIGNTALQARPGGGLTPAWREPQKPELVEEYDPKSQRMVKRFVHPPEQFGGYGAPGNMVVPGKTPGAPTPAGPAYSQPSATEKAEGTKTGEVFADEYKGYLNASVSATRRLTALQRIAQLSPDAYEGGAAPAVQMMRSALATFGVDPGKVPKGEEFNALSQKMVLDSMPGGSLGAQISNSDRDFINNTVPNLSQTKEGRKQLIETSVALAKRDQEVAKLASKYRTENGTLSGFDVFLADWAEKNPLFANRAPAASTQPTTFGDRFNAASPVAAPGAQGIKIIAIDGKKL